MLGFLTSNKADIHINFYQGSSVQLLGVRL